MTLKRALLFFNLLDDAGNLSITNVAVIISVTKLAFSAQFTGAEVGALLATLLNYAHKRFTNSQDIANVQS